MQDVVFRVLAIARHWLRPQYDARLRFMEAQIRMLRSRIDTDRIVPTDRERDELLSLGADFGHEVRDLIQVVVPETYRKWLRDRRAGRRPKRRVGRPRIVRAVRDLVLRIAGENFGWGYRRVGGELKKLGIRIGETSVRNILIEEGLEPRPSGEGTIQWRNFVTANMDSIVACDFFQKRIYTLGGRYTAFVLVFIHLESRRVFCSPATYHPNARWMVQQARNASMWMDEEGIDAKYILRDRDALYGHAFDEFWKNSEVKTVRTPVRSPKANAFAESFIGTLKRECLNHFVCFGRDQLDYILTTWVRHYNNERPHRGVGKSNEVLDRSFRPKEHGRIRCRSELGGIIKHYYRDAA